MTDTAGTDQRVERELRIEASPETVYGYFVEPELMMRWMGSEAELDARPGGGLRIDVDGSHVARGEYVELEIASVHAHGWDHYLERLGIAATGADPGPDRWQDRESA